MIFQHIYDHNKLGSLARSIPNLVHLSLANNTNKKYDSYFCRFGKWCSDHSLNYMPVKPSVVCLYLSSLVVQCVSTSDLDSAFYSIKRFHDVSLKCNPCEDKLVKMCYEGSKRILSKPINKKQPITLEMLHKIVDHFGSNYFDLSGLSMYYLYSGIF